RSIYEALLPTFLSHPAPHHRHRPSLPTRRSSDLPVAPVRRRRPRSQLPVVEHEHGAARRPAGPQLRPQQGPGDPEVEGQLADGLDRKSTRLNSSHLVISYAVFCLKKKKNTTTKHH